MLPLKVYTSNRIFKYYSGFSFFIFIWIYRKEKNEERLVRHETIHFKQQIEMLFIFHWLFYALFYVIARLKGKGHYVAYRYNPFELEAYTHDNNTLYLKIRKPYAWVNYFKTFYTTLSQNFPDTVTKRKHAGWD